MLRLDVCFHNSIHIPGSLCLVESTNHLTCAYKSGEIYDTFADSNDGHIGFENTLDNEEMGTVLPGNRSIVCADAPSYCMTLWTVDHQPHSEEDIVILTQGKDVFKAVDYHFYVLVMPT